MKDYYYILGLRQDATNEEIKKAYKKLSLKFHPDKNEGDKFFEERFKEIQEAYEVLSNLLRRKQFDNLHKEQSREPHYSNKGNNFIPEVVYFSTDKPSFKFGKQIIIRIRLKLSFHIVKT